MTGWTLAIDTSAGTSIALLQAGKLVASCEVANNMKHAETIGVAIAQVLAEAQIRPNAVDKVVVGRGPAPYTGLRVGLAAGIMFSEAVAVPALGVVSLDAIAMDALRALAVSGQAVSQDKPLLVTADARRSEVYWALYSGLSKFGAPVCFVGPAVSKPADLAAELESRGIEPHVTDLPLTAASLGLVAEAHLLAGVDDSDLSPLYLRAPDATMPKANQIFGKRVSS